MFSTGFQRIIVITRHAQMRMDERGINEDCCSKEPDMHTVYYFDENDILVIRLSDKPIVREVSQGWYTCQLCGRRKHG
jgi:hypothetical protein